jgi:flagellar hook protein FlgE
MGLSSALNTSLNGLALNETEINVLGNNISNAGTTGFKESNVAFSTQLANTLSSGSAPSSTDGGTNPRQIGLGGQVAAIAEDFSQGSITSSSSPSDLAIQGDGFFILKGSSGGGQVYTRDGNFSLDSANELTNNAGQQVLGYGVDTNFNIINTGLTQLKIPLGTLHLAQQTKNIQMAGALSPQGVLATQGTLLTGAAMTDTSTAAAATAGTLLSNLALTSAPATPLFAVGQTINLGPTKGGRTINTKTLTITAGTKVSDLETFISNTLGLQTGGTIPVDGDGIPVGISINGSGQLLIKGNRGAVNDIDIPVGSMTVNSTTVPIAFTPSLNRANGESTTTTFTVYDSLGTALNVRMSAYMESQGPNKTTYRYTLESADQSGPAIAIGNGTVDFDNQGRVSSAPTAQFAINRSTTSAISPMLVTIDLSQLSGISSTGSTLNLAHQDGTSPGTLTSYVIDEKGVINGAFDNGIVRTLGQIVMARFPNPQGLLQVGNNNFSQGIASGLPQLTLSGTFGAGTLRAGALEQSNTNIGKNLVNLIVASTNYQGNARVISSVDQLVNVLLTLGR